MAEIFNVIIKQLINELYIFKDIDDVELYIKNILLDKKMNIEILYKNLIYMNTYSKIGMYVIYYKKNLIMNILEKNYKNIKKILEECKSPEIDENEMLNEYEKKELEIILENEMIAINHFIKTNSIKPIKINSKLFNKCLNDICLHTLKKYNLNIKCDKYVMIPDYNEKYKTVIVRSYYLPNLIYDILMNNINIYTNEKFNDKTKIFIEKRYKTEYKIKKKYIELFKV